MAVELVRFVALWAFLRITIASTSQTNVILIMFDDMRPLFHSYGEKHMITPNIDRLSAKSVVFDNANCQIAVCNPSRNSMMTGLRPDTITSYAFENSWAPHLSFPQQFALHGYNIASYGKIYHWDDFEDKLGIGYGMGVSNWYGYQGKEYDDLNSTVNPDRNTPEENFRDYIYTTKMIEGLRNVASRPEYFFLGIGYKLPHIHLHFPWKYFDMYRSHSRVWSKVDENCLRFPLLAPPISYRCCAYGDYRYLNDEGNARWHESVQTNPSISRVFPVRMYQELIWSYSASISYLDTQIGRILDEIQSLGLWENVTIILTSDHGMHNGEKGIWEKWTLFEEATRVPLIIYHPKSPYKGQHYRYPVELVDIYPTLVELNDFPTLFGSTCPRDSKCLPLNGQSLVPALLGPGYTKKQNENLKMLLLPKRVAVTQVLRCASIARLKSFKENLLSKDQRNSMASTLWESCNVGHHDHEVSFMGYSLRSNLFRYTAYVPFDRRVNQVYNLTATEPFHYYFEELYDHQGDHDKQLIDRELVNLARDPRYSVKIFEMRQMLERFLRHRKLTDHAPRKH